MDTIPLEPLIRPGRAGRMLAAILLLVALMSAGAVALPHNRYIRYQQFASGDFSRVRWVYERLWFDRSPIDVALIGSSRLEAAVSGPKLAAALSARLGRPVRVANLAVPWTGRDGNYAIAQELLRTHPEVRLVVLDNPGPTRVSHPAFRGIADASQVLGSPVWINYYWLDNAAYLPFRNMSLFVQSLAPRLFGVEPHFTGHYYARYGGAGFDTTQPFRLDRGVLIDRSKLPDRAALEKAAAQPEVSRPSRLARLTGGDDNIIDDALTERLTDDLRQRCVRVVFVHLPVYKEDYRTLDLGPVARLAPTLMPPQAITADWHNYIDYAHLRSTGINRLAGWFANALAPHVPADAKPGCARDAGRS